MINKIDEEEILKSLDDIPPIEFIDLCKSLPQLEYWFYLKNDCQFLKTSFQKYFSGDEDKSLADLPKERQEFYFYFRQWYLRLYDIIQVGWTEIEQAATARKINLASIGIQRPGQMFTKILENDWKAFFKVTQQDYYRWAPDAARKLAKSDRDIGRDIAKGIEPKNLKSYQNKLKNSLIPLGDELWLRYFCIEVAGKSPKKSPLRNLFVHYKQAQGKLDAHIQSSLHQRHGVRGHEWSKGEFKILGKHGGV